MLLTPVRAPTANAYAERLVQTVRAECPGWLLIVGRGHLEQALWACVTHSNTHRPHRAPALQAPAPGARRLSSATISRPESTDAICSAVSCTRTGELHERLYAPFTLTADRCDPVVLPSVLLSAVHQGWSSSSTGAPPDR
jgi:hypothetical protein